MKAPALQATILAHLRRATGPVSSRDLAARFLRIAGADEPTCHRLLAPLLVDAPGVVHRPDAGWSLAPAPPSAADRPLPRGARPGVAPQVQATGDLTDFVALAGEGAGPGGSGYLKAVSLLPVVGGEECQEEHFPSFAGGIDEALPDPGPGDGALPSGAAVDPRGLGAADLEALVETIGDLPVVCHRVGRDVEPLRRACAGAGFSLKPQAISVARLGHLLLGLKARHPLVDLAQALGVESHGPDDCRGRVRLVARCFFGLVPRLAERGVVSWGALAEFENMPALPLDLSRYGFSAEDLRALPASPGVYRFLDRPGEVIYIGKARNLRERVGSYFVPSARGTAKGEAILQQAHRIEVEPVASELEAVLLEAALLAEHRPRLNRQFDVHERPAPYGPRLNLVVVLPDPPAAGAPPSCTLHLMRGGRYVRRVPGVRARTPGASGRPPRACGAPLRHVASAYFTARPGAANMPHGEESDVDWQLVGSFLTRHRDSVNVLDVDECSTADVAAARLEILIEAALAGDRRVLAR